MSGLREALELAEDRARNHDDLATAYNIMADAIRAALDAAPGGLREAPCSDEQLKAAFMKGVQSVAEARAVRDAAPGGLDVERPFSLIDGTMYPRERRKGERHAAPAASGGLDVERLVIALRLLDGRIAAADPEHAVELLAEDAEKGRRDYAVALAADKPGEPTYSREQLLVHDNHHPYVLGCKVCRDLMASDKPGEPLDVEVVATINKREFGIPTEATRRALAEPSDKHGKGTAMTAYVHDAPCPLSGTEHEHDVVVVGQDAPSTIPFDALDWTASEVEVDALSDALIHVTVDPNTFQPTEHDDYWRWVAESVLTYLGRDDGREWMRRARPASMEHWNPSDTDAMKALWSRCAGDPRALTLITELADQMRAALASDKPEEPLDVERLARAIVRVNLPKAEHAQFRKDGSLYPADLEYGEKVAAEYARLSEKPPYDKADHAAREGVPEGDLG